MAATHIFDAPPEGVAADWTMPQNWAVFTAEQHDTWRSLFDRQSAALDGYACRSFLDGLEILRQLKPGIPDFAELNALLKPVSGWEVVAVPGWIPNRSEEHTSELQSLMRISYAVFCLKTKQSPI